jgi:hypothetical protein
MPNGNGGRGQIPAPVIPPAIQTLKFSFQHLDHLSERFPLSGCGPEFLRQFLHTIHEMSSWTVEQFTDQNNRERRHVIDFSETCEPHGFSNLDQDQLAYHESWQFCLLPTEQWRVHGILIDDTFFVVWLDQNHVLYAH